MGVYNAELFNNLGLCCYYAQQYDIALSCFQRSLSLASSELLADVWYNIGHMAVVSLIPNLNISPIPVSLLTIQCYFIGFSLGST